MSEFHTWKAENSTSIFRMKSIVTNQYFMTHMPYFIDEEINIILNCFENYLTMKRPEVLTIEAIWNKNKHLFEKINDENYEKNKRRSIGSLYKTSQW